jgi:hypothetical protein
MLVFPHVHHDRVNRIGALAGRIVQALADRIETTVFGLGPEHSWSEFESQWVVEHPNIYARIESHGFVPGRGMAMRPTSYGFVLT